MMTQAKKAKARIKMVLQKIENPDGYLFQETIADVCPGCGMTFGYTIQQFRKHIVKCRNVPGRQYCSMNTED